MEYKYDSSGLYFNYFLLSMLSLWLFPVTYMYYTYIRQPSEIPTTQCQCKQCHLKHNLLKNKYARSIKNPRITKTFIFWVLGWILFVIFSYNIFTIEHTEELQIFDPFSILGIDTSASPDDIKRAYRKLSLQWHPDKVDEAQKDEADVKFVEISKAYRSLTDDETRKNWEEFGDPDGKQATAYGIALPAWIVDPSNKAFVLSIYGTIFGIILPYLLAKWWNTSKKFSKDGVLNYTMGIFFQDLKEGFNTKRVLELICSAVEFQELVEWRGERDLNAVMELYRKVRDKIYEKTGEKLELPKKYNQPYCYKAFVIIYAHIFRVEITDELLREDANIIIPKYALLAIKGVMGLTSAHFWLQQSLNCLEVSRMVVQAVPFAWSHTESNDMHQLPYFDAEKIKLARNKRKSVKNLAQLMDIPSADRKLFLTELGFNESQVADITNVGRTIPRLIVESANFVCKGEARITPNSLVTFVLRLKAVDFANEEKPSFVPPKASSSAPASPKTPRSPVSDDASEIDFDSENEVEEDENGVPRKTSKLTKLLNGELFQNKNRPAYCPYFPANKKPVYYMFLCNPRNNRVIGPPNIVNNLLPGTTRTVKFQFQSPPQEGQFMFTCIVQSDTYNTLINKEVKLVVEKAKNDDEELRLEQERNSWADYEEEETMEREGLMGAQTALMAQQGRLSKEAEEDEETDWESSGSEEEEE